VKRRWNWWLLCSIIIKDTSREDSRGPYNEGEEDKGGKKVKKRDIYDLVIQSNNLKNPQ